MEGAILVSHSRRLAENIGPPSHASFLTACQHRKRCRVLSRQLRSSEFRVISGESAHQDQVASERRHWKKAQPSHQPSLEETSCEKVIDTKLHINSSRSPEINCVCGCTCFSRSIYNTINK
jgi:hypothetical protein